MNNTGSTQLSYHTSVPTQSFFEEACNERHWLLFRAHATQPFLLRASQLSTSLDRDREPKQTPPTRCCSHLSFVIHRLLLQGS